MSKCLICNNPVPKPNKYCSRACYILSKKGKTWEKYLGKEKADKAKQRVSNSKQITNEIKLFCQF
jgi:hypothetical protein